MKSGPDKADREALADDVSLEELLEQELLWGLATDTEVVTEEKLSASR